MFKCNLAFGRLYYRLGIPQLLVAPDWKYWMTAESLAKLVLSAQRMISSITKLRGVIVESLLK